MDLTSKLKAIRLIVMDVDGVLSDGSIIYHDLTSEIKAFNVQDGFGITLARRAGLLTAILTGRVSPMVERRAKELKIDFYEAGHFHKAPAMLQLSIKSQMKPNEILYIGDDILDLSCRPYVGLFVAPSNARNRVKQEADWVTKDSGGRGAVREVIDTVLQAKGSLEYTENSFLEEQVMDVEKI